MVIGKWLELLSLSKWQYNTLSGNNSNLST